MFDFGQRSYIMGILNVTPDSFSDGGDFFDLASAVQHAQAMVTEGADIIDIGGESTRPGAEKIDAEEELRRILPVIKALVKEVDVPISVDTYKAKVAQAVLAAGVDIINDIWGLQWDQDLADVVAQYDVPVIIMHNGRNSENKGDIIKAVKRYFVKSIEIAKTAGIKEENIILDPGIGFGITHKQNVEIMRRLSDIKEMGYPVLLGTSRKSMLGNILELPAKERVEGTIATTVIGVEQGIDIFRVHDVKENLKAVKVVDAIYRK